MRPDSLTIERAHTADVAVCTRMLTEHYGAEPSPDRDQCLRLILEDSRCAAYIGRLEDQVVALAIVSRRLSLAFEGVVWSLDLLHVDENYRRLGVARLLLDHIVDEAKRGVCHAVVAEASPDRIVWRSLLRSARFTYAGRLIHWRLTK